MLTERKEFQVLTRRFCILSLRLVRKFVQAYFSNGWSDFDEIWYTSSIQQMKVFRLLDIRPDLGPRGDP